MAVPDDAAVPRGDRLQPRAQARDRLRGEGDLRDKEDDAAAGFQRGLDQAQVHLRLARAGDAMKQPADPEFAGREAARDRRHGAGLPRRLSAWGRARHEFPARHVVRIALALHPGHRLAEGPALDQRAHHGGRRAGAVKDQPL